MSNDRYAIDVMANWKLSVVSLFLILFAAHVACAQDTVFPKGQKNPNPNMVGMVWLYNMTDADSVHSTSVAHVTFEPAARTNWHSHQAGQILLVTSGVGYHQIKGKPVELITKGQVVKCPPNVWHWHGATPNESLTHLAISQNTAKGRVIWYGKVSDEEYNAYNKQK